MILGGDHGQGAFQFGAKVVIVLKNSHTKTSMPPISIPTPKSTLTPPEEKTIVFDIVVAEVICRKDMQKC